MVEMELSLIFNYVDNETMSLLSNDETCLTLLRALFLLLLLLPPSFAYGGEVG